MDIFKKLFSGAVIVGITAFGIINESHSAGINLKHHTKYYGLSAISYLTGNTFSGTMYVVDSNATYASDSPQYGDFDRPFATIDYAVGRCTANNSDLIYVRAGHTETVTAAGGLDLDVAGITIWGEGNGWNRPIITLQTATTADVDVDAANISIYNLIFRSNIDSLDRIIDINSDGFRMVNCITTDSYNSAVGQCDVAVDIASDYVTIMNYDHYGTDSAGCSSAIKAEGADNLRLKDFYIYGDFSYAGIAVGTGTLCTEFDISNGYIWTENAVDICGTASATSTGKWGPNLFLRLQDDAANVTEAVQGADSQFYQPIQIVNADGESGTETNITPSTD